MDYFCELRPTHRREFLRYYFLMFWRLKGRLTCWYERVMGTAVAWKFRNQSKGEFLAGNRTQTGQGAFFSLFLSLSLFLLLHGEMKRR